eukprot:TRINITY_DN67781_c0_g1_i1.p1 TRINITY_DN67781_c0_g1~~TRINITY_DN67781_c0_g1_i1.p1  ORF type:complete len:142 (-),score=35.19 TRINITY_DN67781_c0_g1_i1:141-566(-)
MRLITHNMLVCNVKLCKSTAKPTEDRQLNFPLKIDIEEEGLSLEETEFNKEFVLHILPTLHWEAFVETVNSLDILDDLEMETLPESLPEDLSEVPDELLANIHKLLIDVHIQEGTLTCPHCARVYPVKNSIPNMLLHEDEV